MVGGWVEATREGHQCPPVTSDPDNHRSVAELGSSAITTLLAGWHYWRGGGQFSHFGPPPTPAPGFSQRRTAPHQTQSKEETFKLDNYKVQSPKCPKCQTKVSQKII